VSSGDQNNKENQQVKGSSLGSAQALPSVLRSALSMSVGTLGSRVLGLVRDIVLAAFFSNTVKDAFIVAFRLPNLFRRLLGEGALTASFIPIYVELREGKSDTQAAGELSSAISSLLLVVTSSLSAILAIFMPWVMSLLVGGEGFASVAGKVELAIILGRVMVFYLFLVTSYAFMMAVLNAHRQFFLPALAPAVFNAVFVVLACLPQAWFQFEGQQLAIGVLIGGLVQTGLVAWPCWRQGILPKMVLRWRVPGVFRVLRNTVPGMLGMSVLQFMALANVQFASRLGEGSHTYMYFADRILELPQSLIAISLGVALLPTLSSYFAKGERDKMLESGQHHIRMLWVLAFPSAVGLFVLAQPIVEVLFMRGEFDLEDSIKTAHVLQVYSLLLVFSSTTKVIVPNFFAMKNTWLPALTSSLSLALHLLIAPRWLESFGLVGLVGSTTLAGVFNWLVLAICYQFMVGPWKWGKMFGSVVRMTPGLVVLGGVIASLYPWVSGVLKQFMGVSSVSQVVALFSTIFIGAISYFLVNHICRQTESMEVVHLFTRRIKRRRPS
jgi:putative peptidoglycan lipid II flippase